MIPSIEATIRPSGPCLRTSVEDDALLSFSSARYKQDNILACLSAIIFKIVAECVIQALARYFLVIFLVGLP